MENVKIKTKITNFSNLVDSFCQQHRSHYSREEARVEASGGGGFHRGGQGGASNQPGVAQKYSLFQYKNVIDYIVLDCLSA